MAMWTCKPPRVAESDWERAEREERKRHALWLVGRGVPLATVAAEMGVSYETARQWVRRAGKGAAA